MWFFKEKKRPKLVFVVEDDPSDKLLFKIHVNLDNCIVEYFDSSESIVKEFFTRRPDVVMIDYYLKGKTRGDKLLRFCDNNNIDAFLVTGHEGDILGVDKSRVVKKTARPEYYLEVQNRIMGAVS